MKISSFSPKSGPIGTSVTVTTDFDLPSLDSVYFNYLPAASFTLVNSRTVVAVAPEGFIPGPIKLQWFNFVVQSDTHFIRTYPQPILDPSNITVIPGKSTILQSNKDFGNINYIVLNGLTAIPFVVNNPSEITLDLATTGTTGPNASPLTIVTPNYSFTITLNAQYGGYGLSPYGAMGYGY